MESVNVSSRENQFSTIVLSIGTKLQKGTKWLLGEALCKLLHLLYRKIVTIYVIFNLYRQILTV